MIKTTNLTKYYQNNNKQFLAIKNISLEINQGEIVCIVGPSGSGKSTILRCLTGLDQNYQGQIEINNQNSVNYLKQKRIALVSQNYSNFSWLTVRENIAIGFYKKDLSKDDINKSTDKLLKRVGLHKVQNRYPDKLSGGMQQRVAIARAIAQDTDIMAFDEPFGALDVQTKTQMQEFLAKVFEEENKTMILVTHDIDEAIYLADRIIVLGNNPGEIKEEVVVNIDRPRKPEIRFHQDFIKLKKFISYLIRSESIKSTLEEGILSEEDTFKMGLYIWIGNTPLYYAKDAGLYSQESLNVEQITFDKNKEKVKLWKQGKLDAINVTLDEAVEIYSKTPEMRIVSVLNRSIGGDALITQPQIKSVKELKGKTIGLEKNSVGEFFFSYILNKAGLSLRDLNIIDMKCGEIGAAMISGKIDGGILWEPWLSKVCEMLNINILKTSIDYPVLYDSLIMSDDVLKHKQNDVQKIIKAWGKATVALKEEKTEVVNIVSSHIGIPERELSENLNNIEFFNSVPSNIFGVIKEIEEVLFKEGRIGEVFEPEGMFSS